MRESDSTTRAFTAEWEHNAGLDSLRRLMRSSCKLCASSVSTFNGREGKIFYSISILKDSS